MGRHDRGAVHTAMRRVLGKYRIKNIKKYDSTPILNVMNGTKRRSLPLIHVH